MRKEATRKLSSLDVPDPPYPGERREEASYVRF